LSIFTIYNSALDEDELLVQKSCFFLEVSAITTGIVDTINCIIFFMLETVTNDQTALPEDKTRLQLDRVQTIIKAFEEFLANKAEYQTTDLDQFIAIFNAWFMNFEKDSNLKLDIKSLAEKKSISCTAATLLLGIWFEKTTGKRAIYLIQLSASWAKPSKYNHSIVFLPNESLAPEIPNLERPIFSDLEDLSGKGEFVDYLIEGGLAKRTLPPIHNLRLYSTQEFVTQRVEDFSS